MLLVPPALTFTAVAINLAIGAELATSRPMPSVTDFAVQFVVVLLMVGLREEPAWRGYTLPRLMAGRPALTAALILGLFHTVWHLPLFGVEYDLANRVPWAISVFCFSVVTAWMWLHTGGSLLLPMLMHTVINAVNPVVWRWFGGADQLHMWWISAGLWAVLTIGIIAVTGPVLTRTRPMPRFQSPPARRR